MVDPERHAQDRGSIESILRQIPGFQGYLEKEYRRESDYLARQWLAGQLEGAKPKLDDHMRRLLEAANLDALPAGERLRSRIDGLIGGIRGAVRGYSGVFDFVRVDQSVLETVYERDMSLIHDVEQFAEHCGQLTMTDDASPAWADRLLGELEIIEQAFARRGELLAGLTG